MALPGRKEYVAPAWPPPAREPTTVFRSTLVGIVMLKLTTASSLTVAAALLATSAAHARTVTIPFSASNFSDPLDIDNTYFPLVPGTTFTYKAETPDGCEVDVVTVTDDTRVIDGVTTRVVHDQAFEGETCTTAASALVEDTFDYYAQDNANNVWYFGEDTFHCEGAGSCTPSSGGWIAGVNGAGPGIIMLAQPRSGDTYFQEQAPDVALDQATVTAVGVKAKLRRDDAFPPGSFSDCIVTKEFTTLEKGSIEYKTYCPEVGLVSVDEHHGKVVRFELVTNSSDALRFRTPH
jgi:hypothetical protein